MRTAWSAAAPAGDLSRACVFLTARRVPLLSESQQNTYSCMSLWADLGYMLTTHVTLWLTGTVPRSPPMATQVIREARWVRDSAQRAVHWEPDPSSLAPVGRLVCYTWLPERSLCWNPNLHMIILSINEYHVSLSQTVRKKLRSVTISRFYFLTVSRLTSPVGTCTLTISTAWTCGNVKHLSSLISAIQYMRSLSHVYLDVTFLWRSTISVVNILSTTFYCKGSAQCLLLQWGKVYVEDLESLVCQVYIHWLTFLTWW